MSQANITTDRQNALGDNYVRQQLLGDDEQRQRVRANASLPDEAWTDIDDSVYTAMDGILNIVSDVRSAGLTVDESIFNKTTEWQPIDDEAEATVAMDPETATDEGAVEYELDGAPLPIIMADFSIGWRDSGPSDDMTGGSLDMLNAEAAGRAIGEASEDLLYNGWEPSIGSNGYTAYGLTNHPLTHTGTLGDWANAPGEVRPDLRAMANDLKDDHFYPDAAGYWVYMDRASYDTLEDIDPHGDGNLLLRDRVEGLSFLDRISVSDTLPENSVVMFRPTRDVVDLAIAQEETTVQWENPFRDFFKVMSAWTPRVKADARDQMGVAYYTS